MCRPSTKNNWPFTGDVRDYGTAAFSALARPANLVAYESDAEVAAVAAAYAFGIVRNHPFVDGNKRTGFVAMELCLLLNGHRLEAGDEDCVMAMLKLASGDTEEDPFAAWIRTHLERI